MTQPGGASNGGETTSSRPPPSPSPPSEPPPSSGENGSPSVRSPRLATIAHDMVRAAIVQRTSFPRILEAPLDREPAERRSNRCGGLGSWRRRGQKKIGSGPERGEAPNEGDGRDRGRRLGLVVKVDSGRVAHRPHAMRIAFVALG